MTATQPKPRIADPYPLPLATEVLDGLRAEPKRIAPKYFYDQTGARLFDAITALDEYYLTRTEKQIILAQRTRICAAIGAGANLIEPGAGSCEKIRWLLPELEPVRYIPMDISAAHLATSAARLREAYPELDICPQVCDHTQGLEVPAVEADAPTVFFYPGSSIGNFEPPEATEFMRAMHRTMGPARRGGLLIGIDAKKDKRVLEAAYDDREGVTAAFNLNVLEHLNRLLRGNLARENFAHVARYDEARGRIEMHLHCLRSHSAMLAGEVIDFEAGELIHTENSYKYAPREFAALAAEAGFRLRELWQDERAWFSVMYFETD
jgi:dimethylhistidine N-methyltransferase